jgi:quinoprotein glucose dehydrogenase
MPKFMRAGGVGLLLIAGLLGAAAALYDYFAPSTGIDHTAGVVLVLTSCVLMVLATVAVLVIGSSVLTNILIFLIFLDILGTGTAAWFLESELMMAAMAIATLGFLLRLTNHRVAQ